VGCNGRAIFFSSFVMIADFVFVQMVVAVVVANMVHE
jgi:hypothetical protein